MQLRERYFLYILLAGSTVLTFLVFLPFLIPLLLGAIFAILLTPVFKRILTYTGGKSSLSAFLTVLLFIVIIGIPLTGIGILGYQETQSMFGDSGSASLPVIQSTIVSIQDSLPSWMQIDMSNQVDTAVEFLSKNIGNIFSATFSTILAFLLMILSMFFFLRDGRQWRITLFSMSPLSDERNQFIFSEMKKTISGIIQGYLFIALIQGILMGVGLWLFDVPHVVLLGITAGISALIPVVGTLAVSVPVIIYLYITGGILPAVGFAAWAGVLVGMVDNVLNPIIVGRQVNIHPLMILLSVLGGVSFFGPAGVLLGPLLVSLLHTLTAMYRKDFE